MVERAHRGWRQRVPRYLVVVGLAALLVHYWREQPVDVVVVYHFGGLADGLQGARMSYEREGASWASVTYSFRSQPAGTSQAHAVRLAPGEYRVRVELRRSAGVVRLSRSLSVREAGKITVYLEDGP